MSRLAAALLLTVTLTARAEEPARELEAGVRALLARDAAARDAAKQALAGLAKGQDAAGQVAAALVRALGGEEAAALEACGPLAAEDGPAGAWLVRGALRLRRAELPQALVDAREAVRRAPRSAEARALEGEARLRLRLTDPDARGALDEALKLEPAHPRALALRALARVEREVGDFPRMAAGDWLAAVRDETTRALELSPREALAHAARAEALAGDGDHDGALDAAKRAVEAAPDDLLVLLLRARLFALAHQETWAVQDAEAAVERAPEEPRVLVDAAVVLIAARKARAAPPPLERAIALLDKALAKEPKLAWAHHYKGVAHGHARDPRAAVASLSRALELQPIADAYFRRGCLRFDLQLYREALEDISQAEALHDPSGPPEKRGSFRAPDPWLVRGHCHYQLRSPAEALAAYERYLELAPPGAAGAPKVKQRVEELRSRREF